MIDAIVEPEDLRADLVARLALAGGKDRSFSDRLHGGARRSDGLDLGPASDTMLRTAGGPGMTATDVYYDPYDYVIDADPYPVWRRMRDEAPVYYNEKLDFWALSRYDDVLRGLLDHESFVSSHGIMLEIITDEPYGIPMMIMMDPPEHTKLRKLGGAVRHSAPDRRPRGEDRVARERPASTEVEGEDEFDYVEHFAGCCRPP